MTLRGRVLAAVAYVLVLAIVALAIPAAVDVRDRIDAEVRSQARAQAELVAASSADALAPLDRPRLRRLTGVAAATTHGRVLVVDAAGRVRADSTGVAPQGADYGGRPELARALGGRPAQVQRHSETLGTDLLATTAPVVRSGRTIGAVRITQEVQAVDRAVHRAWAGLGLLAAAVLLLGLAVAAAVASGLTRPLRRLEAAVARVAGGDLTVRAPVEGSHEQQVLAETFNNMTGQVRRTLDAQREFVADASHQLRTPLTGLRLRLEAAERATDDPRVTRQLEAGIAETDRLAAILADLLELSRAGERPARPASADAGRALAAVAERFRAAAAARGQRFDVVAGAGPCALRCSEEDLARILDVLVENALAYAPDGTTVTLTAMSTGCAVRDEGPGLAPDEDEAVFARFHRGSAGRSGPAGTGLGLAIARELAGRWDGSVELRNAPGGGAVATVALPSAAAPRPVLAAGAGAEA